MTRLELRLRDLVIGGTLEEIRVSSHHEGDRGYVERWFRTATGAVWRLVRPRPPHGGVFERVSALELEHPRLSASRQRVERARTEERICGGQPHGVDPTAGWDEISGFGSPQELLRFRIYLRAQVDDGTLRGVAVGSRFDGSWMFDERWFETATGVVWRFVAPEPPFYGTFERVSEHEREHPRLDPG